MIFINCDCYMKDYPKLLSVQFELKMTHDTLKRTFCAVFVHYTLKCMF